MSKDDTIKLILDLDNLPPLTEKQKAMRDRLAAMSDEDIDYSDIPHHDFAIPPPKEETRLRLDGDVIEWLAESKHGADWRANSILRHEMLRTRGRAEVDRRLGREAKAAEAEKMPARKEAGEPAHV